MSAFDDFGNRMKLYEGVETERRFIPLLPIYARLDGRSFHRFTKDMERPYDSRFVDAMIETTKHLVGATHAKIGYTQSDEISLTWKADSFKSGIFFEGKIQKMTSVLASMATVAFVRAVLQTSISSYVDKLPHFDCRVISLPNDTEVANMFLWRTADATKNAISMAARHYYSTKQLYQKSSSEMQEMLFQKGVNFNDYPAFFKRGTFVRRVLEQRKLSETIIKKIQTAGRIIDPDQMYTRSVIKSIDMPIFSKVTNRVGVIFDGEIPVTMEE